MNSTLHTDNESAPAIAEVLRKTGVTVFERGWLSANNILLRGDGPTALVDSGYASHANQTLALLKHSLAGQPLELLLNTHLHSDHCGGNAILQACYPQLSTMIPPGHAAAVRLWDEDALTYRSTGQFCPRFDWDGLLKPGSSIQLGSHTWDIHAAKGHDPHSIVLHLPEWALLISADALWQNGFGVVFPELEGNDAFDEVAGTLDVIERLAPSIIIPGHGAPFQNLKQSLSRARSRLHQFESSPVKHHRHAMKVLIKFKLLEWQQIERHQLENWAHATPYLKQAMPPKEADAKVWMDELLGELASASALELSSGWVLNR